MHPVVRPALSLSLVLVAVSALVAQPRPQARQWSVDVTAQVYPTADSGAYVSSCRSVPYGCESGQVLRYNPSGGVVVSWLPEPGDQLVSGAYLEGERLVALAYDNNYDTPADSVYVYRLGDGNPPPVFRATTPEGYFGMGSIAATREPGETLVSFNRTLVYLGADGFERGRVSLDTFFFHQAVSARGTSQQEVAAYVLTRGARAGSSFTELRGYSATGALALRRLLPESPWATWRRDSIGYLLSPTGISELETGAPSLPVRTSGAWDAGAVAVLRRASDEGLATFDGSGAGLVSLGDVGHPSLQGIIRQPEGWWAKYIVADLAQLVFTPAPADPRPLPRPRATLETTIDSIVVTQGPHPFLDAVERRYLTYVRYELRNDGDDDWASSAIMVAGPSGPAGPFGPLPPTASGAVAAGSSVTGVLTSSTTFIVADYAVPFRELAVQICLRYVDDLLVEPANIACGVDRATPTRVVATTDPTYALALRAFPNPATDVLRFEAPGHLIAGTLVDALGRGVRTLSAGELAGGRVSVADLPGGAYVLEVTDARGTRGRVAVAVVGR